MAWGKVTTIMGPAGPTKVSADANNAMTLGGDSLIYLSSLTYLNRAGGTMTGPLTLAGPPAGTSDAATKAYVDSATGAAVPLAGGTMTGLLILSADPGVALGAATKQYVDTSITAAPNKTITLSGDVTGTGTAGIPATVTALQGKAVSATAPSTNEVLEWSGTAWTPTALPAGVAGADPTAQVSGTAVNGTAPTFMRSDAAPALATTGVTAGPYTYASLTVDAQGRLTAASSGAAPPSPASVAPLMDGTAAVGTTTLYAREDHIHPTDTSLVPMAGGVTMTGLLVLSGDPTAANGAATRNYVDTQITTLTNASNAKYLALAGGTMTGPLTLIAPVNPTDAATKAYVDAAPNLPITLSGDVSGTGTAGIPATVIRLQGQPVSATAPTTNEVLEWNGSAWTPTALPVGVAGADPTATVSGTAVVGTATTYMRSDAAPALANTAVIAGSYTYASLTVDAQGRLTAASTGAAPPSPASATPLMDGTAVVGASALYAREDHVHPTDTTLVPLAGGTMTGLLVLSADPTLPTQAATKNYVDSHITSGLTNYVTLDTSQTISGAKTFSTTVGGVTPVAATDLSTKGYVDTSISALSATYVAKAGGTMTGLLTLSGNPSGSLDAAPKQYVDSQISTLSGTAATTYVALAGSTMTGFLILNADPTNSLGAVTKQYVDAVNTNLTTNYVTLATAQTITGQKTFTQTVIGVTPVNPTDLSTKGYVDTTVAGYLPLTGGNLSGNLGFTGAATVVFAPGGATSASISMNANGDIIATGLAGANNGKTVNLTTLAWGGSVIPDATGTPAAGQAWGRLNGAWTQVAITGPQGIQGPIGNTGATGPIGPPGANWVGTWSASTAYNQYDAVLYNGSSYIAATGAIAAGGAAPDVNPAWQLVAHEGIQGIQGIQGPQGVAGAAAYDTLTASYTMPAVNATADAAVNNGAAFGVGQVVYVSPIGYLSITAIAGNTLTLQNLGYSVNQAPGSVAPLAATVSGTGPSGPQGIQGIQGVTGATGTAATATAGTTTTLAPGAASTVTNAGTTAAAVFNFGIARGSEWFTGSGAPGTVAGSLPGDMYMDTVTGDVYTLS